MLDLSRVQVLQHTSPSTATEPACPGKQQLLQDVQEVVIQMQPEQRSHLLPAQDGGRCLAEADSMENSQQAKHNTSASFLQTETLPSGAQYDGSFPLWMLQRQQPDLSTPAGPVADHADKTSPGAGSAGHIKWLQVPDHKHEIEGIVRSPLASGHDDRHDLQISPTTAGHAPPLGQPFQQASQDLHAKASGSLLLHEHQRSVLHWPPMDARPRSPFASGLNVEHNMMTTAATVSSPPSEVQQHQQSSQTSQTEASGLDQQQQHAEPKQEAEPRTHSTALPSDAGNMQPAGATAGSMLSRGAHTWQRSQDSQTQASGSHHSHHSQQSRAAQLRTPVVSGLSDMLTTAATIGSNLSELQQREDSVPDLHAEASGFIQQQRQQQQSPQQLRKLSEQLHEEEADGVPDMRPGHMRRFSRTTADSMGSEQPTWDSGDEFISRSDLNRDSVSTPSSHEGDMGGPAPSGNPYGHYDPKRHVIIRLECISETEMKVTCLMMPWPIARSVARIWYTHKHTFHNTSVSRSLRQLSIRNSAMQNLIIFVLGAPASR